MGCLGQIIVCKYMLQGADSIRSTRRTVTFYDDDVDRAPSRYIRFIQAFAKRDLNSETARALYILSIPQNSTLTQSAMNRLE